MKKRTSVFFALPFAFLACNNDAKDSVEQADSANEAKLDSSTAGKAIATDQESTDFLVNAANGGMAEVEAGQIAQQKAKKTNVKDFAAMMVRDHSAANEQVKMLAAQRNVTLPAMPGDEKKKGLEELNKKTGADFDKSYMKMMVNDHEKAIDLFENASSKVNDAEVKAFVDNTLPKLKNHLDSAKAIQRTLK